MLDGGSKDGCFGVSEAHKWLLHHSSSQSFKTLLTSASSSLQYRFLLVALCCSLQNPPADSYPLYHKLSLRSLGGGGNSLRCTISFQDRYERHSRRLHSSTCLLNTKSSYNLQGGSVPSGDWSNLISSSSTSASADDSTEQGLSPILQNLFSSSPVIQHKSLPNSPSSLGVSSFRKDSPTLQSESVSPLETYRLSLTLQEQIILTFSIPLLLIAFATIIFLSGPGAWRYYLAGGMCAAVSHGISTPIDVIKTRQQVDESLKSMSMYKSTIQIVKQDGIHTLLAGLGPTTIGYLLEGAMKFGIYEVTKPVVGKILTWIAAMTYLEFLNSKILVFGIAGIIAGIAASFVICPMEAIRIRLVADSHLASNGWILAGFRMFQNEGSHGMWKGLHAMLWKQVPYTVTKNVSFDLFTTLAYSTLKSFGYHICGHLKFWIPLLAAMITSILSAVSSQPGDVLLSLVNANEGDVRVRDLFKNIMKTDGMKGFFVGMRARLIHVGTIVTTQLILYDFVKRICGIAATGL